MATEYLHTMLRVRDLDATLKFFCEGLGMVETLRYENKEGRFTLSYLAAPGDEKAAREDFKPLIELTYNWDPEDYDGGRNFGHLSYRVDDIYEACKRFEAIGVTIARPPRDGQLAFVRSPDNISVELIQKGSPLTPREPWASMENHGTW
jgi:lactoylglutathione lyase